MTTFALVAHADDEVLGAGATIARLADEGEDVHVLILGESRVPGEHIEQAIKHVGATWMRLGFPDQGFDTVPLLEVTQVIEAQIIAYEPHTVYTHHPGDLNLDHQITSRAVLTACRPVNGCPVQTVYAMEIASSTEWGDGSFHPNTYVDITGTPLLRKVEAMEMYETERRDWPHPRSPKAIRSLAQLRGNHVGLEAAEAFQLIRQILP